MMRTRKFSKLPAFAVFMTTLEVSIFVLCHTSSMIVEGLAKHLGNELNSTAALSFSGGSEDFCTTPGCMNAASMILRNMDPNVDPCQNFYRYACGGFLNSTIIPDDKSSVDVFGITNDKLQEQLRTIFETRSNRDQLKPYKLVKKLYKSCMNTTAIEAKGLEPLRAILEKLGGWPVVDGDSWKGNFDWIKSTNKFRDIGYHFNFFINFDIDVDMKNNTKRVIVLDQAKLRLHREYLMKGFDSHEVTAYYGFMVDVAVMLGAQKDRAMEELKKSLDFEMKLANISLPVEEMRNGTKLYNPMTLGNLTKEYPSIPWREFFSRMLPSSITVQDNEVAIVTVPSYIKNFDKLISETPKRVQANYAMWNAVADSTPYLNKQLRERQLAYETVVSGRTQSPLRWKECINRVLSDGGVSVHSMYVREYFNKDAKKNAVDMVMEIKKQFRKMLTEADWMDEKTLKKALAKADTMASHIAYPDELVDDDELDELLENLELSEDNYFDNFFKLSRFSTEHSFSKLREPYNKSDWLNHEGAADVEAYYSSTDNSIQFPAGILQGAFFDDDRPKYMNYGSIGGIIGHEITHGFDNVGSQFDMSGNLVDWWDPATKNNYFERTSCIIDQYDQYVVEEVNLKLNGFNTQSENIADNGGIKAAYRAYNCWASRNSPEKKLPGINKTPKQMFWISAANLLCSKNRLEDLKDKVTTGHHMPTEFRIIGPFSNMPEFAEDFHCPVGSPMNPQQKCSVW